MMWLVGCMYANIFSNFLFIFLVCLVHIWIVYGVNVNLNIFNWVFERRLLFCFFFLLSFQYQFFPPYCHTLLFPFFICFSVKTVHRNKTKKKLKHTKTFICAIVVSNYNCVTV